MSYWDDNRVPVYAMNKKENNVSPTASLYIMKLTLNYMIILILETGLQIRQGHYKSTLSLMAGTFIIR